MEVWRDSAKIGINWFFDSNQSYLEPKAILRKKIDLFYFKKILLSNLDIFENRKSQLYNHSCLDLQVNSNFSEPACSLR